MSDATIRRQDESGMRGPGLGIFVDGVLIQKVDERDDPLGLKALAAIRGARADVQPEVLLICHLHHTQSAVDCEECEPV